MPSGRSLYHSPRLAAGYAFARPAVHPRIIDRVRDRLRLEGRAARALDIGCGAGRSTAALQTLAGEVVGIDPAVAMLEHRRAVAPRARFVAAEAERLPFVDQAFDFMTAAGSINYADQTAMLAEVARVLAPGGTLVIYDFSAGRRFADDPSLEAWYDEFDRRYPDAAGYALDVRLLPVDRAGLTLARYEEFSVPVAMNAADYLRYAMSETRVELALSRGAAEEDIRAWVQSGVERVFGSAQREVIFHAYAAYVRRSVRE